MEDDGAFTPAVLRLVAQHIDQEVGEFVGPRREGRGLSLVRRVRGEQGRVVVLDHAGAGAGGNDYRPVVREQCQLLSGNLARLVGKSAGVGRLTATGLSFREMDPDAFVLEQGDGVHAGTREKLVDHAGREEIDIAGAWRRSLRLGHLVSGKLRRRYNGKTNRYRLRNLR